MRQIVERVVVAADRIEICISRFKLAEATLAERQFSKRFDLAPVTLSIEASLRRAGKEKRLVIAQGGDAEVNAGLSS